MEPITIIITVLSIISLVMYAWAIYDLIKHRSEFKKRIYQGLWLMFVVFVPVIGAVTYLSVRNSVRPG
ncbi:MAG: PLDc N-terminal domain-containing protein [Bacteroidota bacterium]|nr:PLDc N-terminal domain-containing protein [Bacteroidota bacterium]